MLDYFLQDGLLYLNNKLVLPADSSDIILQVLREFHSSPIGGHSGFLRTHARIALYFFWPGMRKDIKAFIRSCLVCQCAKSLQLHPAGLLSPLLIPTQV